MSNSLVKVPEEEKEETENMQQRQVTLQAKVRQTFLSYD